MKNKISKIPLAILKPLTRGRWRRSEYDLNKFDSCIEIHKQRDFESGNTCAYAINEYTDSLKPDEMKAIINADAIDPVFHKSGVMVNQHWQHSIEQFYAEVTKAWDEHCQRVEALKDTPSGKIFRGE